MNTLSTDRKLQPTWSGPYRVLEQLLNSYKLEELDGTPKPGEYNARRLRLFTPREGTELASQQKELEERLAEEEGGSEEPAGLDEPDSFIPESTEVADNEDEDPEGRGVDGEVEDRTVNVTSNIASRVVGRRGRRQKEGGGWNSR